MLLIYKFRNEVVLGPQGYSVGVLPVQTSPPYKYTQPPVHKTHSFIQQTNIYSSFDDNGALYCQKKDPKKREICRCC